MPKKCILLLLDGLGDRSYESLGGQTPLQAAHTPTLDKLAADGSSGLYHPTVQGQALPSENAHFSLFGYDMADFPGRGALEALGAGVDLLPSDVALLAHFASISQRNRVLWLDNEKPDVDAKSLAGLNDCMSFFESDDVAASFHSTGGIRGIIRLRGDVSPFVTDSDPITAGRPLSAVLPWQDCGEDMAAAHRTANALRGYLVWAYGRLSAHKVNHARKQKGQAPVNGLVSQRAGRLKKVVPFRRKYGLRGLSMASGLVYQGLGTYLGMDIKKAADTDDAGADIEGRLRTAFAGIKDYDFFHIHTKTPDEAAHEKDPMLKKTVIESLDAGIGRAISPMMDDPDILLVVTADHSTPSGGPLIHSGESVPLIMAGRGVRKDTVCRFDEIHAAHGALGGLRGKEIMYLILNHLDRAKLGGLMDTPADQPYWPGDYEPFRVDFS
ncbi:MAG: alkaline phosphatase family protein [Desulfobacterales bacterium]|nr:alkaline phosphatase family protein [Desulfobacterales bacterium]